MQLDVHIKHNLFRNKHAWSVPNIGLQILHCHCYFIHTLISYPRAHPQVKSTFWKNNFTKWGYLQILCIKKNKNFRFTGWCKISLSMLEKCCLKCVFPKKSAHLSFLWWQKKHHLLSFKSRSPWTPIFVLLHRNTHELAPQPGSPASPHWGLAVCTEQWECTHLYPSTFHNIGVFLQE